MRILTKGEEIDFETPIFMTELQKEEFLRKMEIIFKDRLLKMTIVEAQRRVGPIGGVPYTLEQIPKLADIEHIDEKTLADEFGKTERAIYMKRGRLLKEIFESLKKEKKTTDKRYIKKFIEEKYGAD